MAYLNKHPKSRYWSAVFRDGQGNQCRRSTKIEAYPPATEPKERARLAYEARKKALKIADAYERAARGELTRETIVRETISEMVELAGGPRVKEKTVADFLNAWVDSSERSGKSETSLSRYRYAVKEFLAFLGERARVPVSHLTPTDVQKYVEHLTAQGRAGKTITHALVLLRMPFAEGCRLGTVTSNPAAAVRAPGAVSVDREPFTPEEIQAIIAACDQVPHGDQWRTVVTFGYYAALRLGDATSLTWGNIDLEKELLTIVPQKTRRKARKLIAPLHPRVIKHLSTLTPSIDPSAPLTPDLIREPGQRANLSRSFSRIMIAAGIDARKERAGGRGRNVSKKCFHALRHTLASHLANAGVSPELRMLLTGHTDLRIHADYTHMTLDTLRQAQCRIA